MKQDLDKTYDHNKTEDRIYKLWEKSGFFNPDKLPKRHKKPFTIIMPPSNANGSLHIGHGVGFTLQDIMIRYKRMQGFKTLWLPGTDHAGFETQVVFEKELEKQNRSRFSIPRKQLYKETLDFTLRNKKIITSQIRKLGASCDWSREKFTLEKDLVKIFKETFEKLKKDGLVYKDKRIVNWCTKHQTSLSDLEIEYQEKKANLWYIKYPLVENCNDFIVVATTRPETMLGDTAIAVNPKDNRYKNLIGKKAIIPLINREIPIIKDSLVDPEFGTGAVKVTPAHDFNDFEIGKKHNLETRQIIDFRGKLNQEAKLYTGLKTIEAREKIIEDLTNKNLIEKIDEDYKHNISVCYKCKNAIEPMILDNQWFIKMTEKPKGNKLSLRDAAVKAVKEKKIEFIPKKFEKVFFYWMKNLKDWNISRQIVWGIEIPDRDKKNKDVFDTWFSSGQWPFATLMANKKQDYKKFYPTDVMETGWDILFFWVARMIMLSLYTTKKIPFKYVYLHGLVRDKERQKMSKSKGNVIDPLGVIDIYGTDSLRMALIVGNTPGNDPVIYEEKIRGYRNFANKIWNASRFVLMNTKNFDSNKSDSFYKKNLSTKQKQRLKELEKMSKEITKLMDKFKFYKASEKIYHYFWHIFCDKIIEENKLILQQGKEKEKQITRYFLLDVLKNCLIILHPFMPFITEEIYQKLPLKNKKMLIIENWPKYK